MNEILGTKSTISNEFDKDLVLSVLNSLLFLKDGDLLQHGSGVCRELLEAVIKKTGIERSSRKCTEYLWANSIANDKYVDVSGKMTPTRREFIHKLLAILDLANE